MPQSESTWKRSPACGSAPPGTSDKGTAAPDLTARRPKEKSGHPILRDLEVHPETRQRRGRDTPLPVYPPVGLVIVAVTAHPRAVRPHDLVVEGPDAPGGIGRRQR